MITDPQVFEGAYVPLIGMVPIVHGDEFYSRVDDERIFHRFVGQDLALDRYGTAELADILEPRARKGLGQRVARDYLERIADHVGGGAREAIQTLRADSEMAGEEQCAVEGVDTDAAYQRALRRIREANLASLPFHHHIVYELIRDAGELRSEALHDRYDAVAEGVYRGRDQTPIGKRALRNKLAKL